MIDFDTLTLDEVEQIETFTNRSISTIMDDDAPKGRVLKVLIWVITKRTDPNFTLEQAGAKSLADATEMFAGDEPDPK
jgi:hypothetical protein